MSLAQIEAELANLSTEELRRLALRSWDAFRAREGDNACVEESPQVLDALDQAIIAADTCPGRSYSGDEVRNLLQKWITK